MEICQYINRPLSITKKQIVACTGLFLWSFVVMHLVGNLFIYGGPDVYNSYSAKLISLRPALYFAEAGLIMVVLVHIVITFQLIIYNYKARPVRYACHHSSSQRKLAPRLMKITGPFLLVYVIFHLFDFTFGNLSARGIVGGVDLGLYGLVYNSFKNPVHSLGYILAMFALGFHLTHAIQSSCQTFGLNHSKYTPGIIKLSVFLGAGVAILFSSIPIMILTGVIGP